jgi:hypothetical protein
MVSGCLLSAHASEAIDGGAGPGSAARSDGAPRFPDCRPAAYAVRGGVVATGAPDGTLPTGAAVAGVTTGEPVAGAGVATGGETGEVVTGVTTSCAVMEPLTFFF